MRFTVRRRASAKVSPCCHRPSGGDVACSVYVGVARTSLAGLALENRLALTVFGSDMPAQAASLRRVRGRDVLDPARGFMLQTRSEQAPTAAGDRTVQTAFLGNTPTRLLHRCPRRAGHRTHVKCFNADRIEPAYDIRGGFFDPVLTSVGLAGLEVRDCSLCASSPVGATLGAGQALLQHLQPPGLTAAQARGVQQLTGRQGGRHRNATVDAHHGAVAGRGEGFRCVGERDMPAAGPITGDAVGLHAFRNRPRQAKPDPTDLGHPHTAQPAVQTLDVMSFHRDLPEALMHTRFAPRRAAMRCREKVTHRLGEIPQRLLLHRLRACRQPIVLGAGRGQLSTLLDITRRAATRPPVQLLLDRQVPHIAGVAAMLGHDHRLLGTRKQPVSLTPCKLAVTTDNPPKGDAAFPPPDKARGFYAATSR